MKKRPTLLVRLDSAEKKQKLKQIATRQGFTSLNRLINSWADTFIAMDMAEAMFRAAAARGKPERLLKLLDDLDEQDRQAGIANTRP